MIKMFYAMAIAGLVLAAVAVTSEAAPIAPLGAATSAHNGQAIPVYYYYHHHHRHCWRGRYGHLHCRW